MTIVDRVARMEGAQAPFEFILGWLERAHSFPNLDSLARAEAQEEESDMTRFMKDVNRSLANQPNSLKEPDRARKRTQIRAEALFLRAQAMAVDAAATELVGRFELRLAMLGLLGLIGGPDQSSAEADPVYGPNPPPSASTPTMAEQVADLLADVLADVEVEEQARSLIEARYYSGRSLLFEDTASAWKNLHEEIDSIRKVYGIPDHSDDRPLHARARARASEIFDTVRLKLFEQRGRKDLAARIDSWRLRGNRPAGGRLIESAASRRFSEPSILLPPRLFEQFLKAFPQDPSEHIGG